MKYITSNHAAPIIRDLENKIKDLTDLIANRRYSEQTRAGYTRSRAAYKASLTRLKGKILQGKPVAPVKVDADKAIAVKIVPAVAADRVYHIVNEDKDANVKVKSSATTASLGWLPPKIDKEAIARPFKKSVYYEVMAVHSHTNYTS